MACGMSRETAWAAPFGEVCDLAAIYQIKFEDADYKEIVSRDEEIIPDVD